MYSNNVISETLLVGLHGRAGNGERYAQKVGLDGPLFGTVRVICPDAPTENDDGQRRWRHEGTDDVPFIEDIIQNEINVNGVDPNKIHICGQANGGIMGYRMVHEFPDMFESITVTASYYPEMTSTYAGLVTHIHGYVDDKVLYDNTHDNTRTILMDGGADVMWVGVQANHYTTPIDRALALRSTSIAQLIRDNI